MRYWPSFKQNKSSCDKSNRMALLYNATVLGTLKTKASRSISCCQTTHTDLSRWVRRSPSVNRRRQEVERIELNRTVHQPVKQSNNEYPIQRESRKREWRHSSTERSLLVSGSELWGSYRLLQCGFSPYLASMTWDKRRCVFVWYLTKHLDLVRMSDSIRVFTFGIRIKSSSLIIRRRNEPIEKIGKFSAHFDQSRRCFRLKGKVEGDHIWISQLDIESVLETAWMNIKKMDDRIFAFYYFEVSFRTRRLSSQSLHNRRWIRQYRIESPSNVFRTVSCRDRYTSMAGSGWIPYLLVRSSNSMNNWRLSSHSPRHCQTFVAVVVSQAWEQECWLPLCSRHHHHRRHHHHWDK